MPTISHKVPGLRGVAVVYPTRQREPRHEHVVHNELGKKIAAMLGLEFAGEYRASTRYGGRLYFIPTDTVVGLEKARRLGMNTQYDLFGGVVPQPFVATKAITHALVHPNACAPQGWSLDFERQVRGAVLTGTTVFTLEDARSAGARLIKLGPLRVKPVLATGGRGQCVATDADELEHILESVDAAELSSCGLVLEQHLENVQTYSVGQVHIAGLLASYYGTQRLTTDNSGAQVYGGSDLVIARGNFSALLRLDLPEHIRLAISQGQAYDAAARKSFPGLLASRRNYDIAQGLDAKGRRRSGVLEQSWRIGGASSAEVAALEAFHGRPDTHALRASSIEIFNNRQRIPPGATILFSGLDEDVGFITKCVTMEAYDSTQ